MESLAFVLVFIKLAYEFLECELGLILDNLLPLNEGVWKQHDFLIEWRRAAGSWGSAISSGESLRTNTTGLERLPPEQEAKHSSRLLLTLGLQTHSRQNLAFWRVYPLHLSSVVHQIQRLHPPRVSHQLLQGSELPRDRLGFHYNSMLFSPSHSRNELGTYNTHSVSHRLEYRLVTWYLMNEWMNEWMNRNQSVLSSKISWGGDYLRKNDREGHSNFTAPTQFCVFQG